MPIATPHITTVGTDTRGPALSRIPPPRPLRPFTVAEYFRLIQAGVLADGERVELLEGWIVPKLSCNPPHDVAIDKVQEALRSRVPPGWRVRVQCAVVTGDSVPEPDVAAMPGPAERYLAAPPGPGDVALLIEVADSSLTFDREDKARAYARAGFAVYWIVNLKEACVEVYTDPTGPASAPAYRQRAVYGIADAVPLSIPGGSPAAVPVRELLP